MRRSFEPIKLEEDGRLICVNLGADYCAEHEWGISGIRNKFGIPDKATRKVNGIHARTITKNEGIHFIKTKKEDVDIFILSNYGCSWEPEEKNKKLIEEHAKRNWHPIEGKVVCKQEGVTQLADVYCAWSEKEFMIASTDKEMMETLWEAFQDLDLAICLSGGGVFQNAGLSFWIVPNMPEDIKSHWEVVDIDWLDLEDAVEASKIRDILKKAGKEYHALSPRWKDENKNDFHFWLNPMEQDIHNCGWFELKDLLEWAKNKGPILKEKEKVE